MIRLTSASLAVDLLDPSHYADAAHLGARFCHGGFIWQIFQRDAAGTLTPLLSGPEYPSPTPDPFNAQGLPESFRHRTRAGAPFTWNSPGTHGVALGAGELTLDAAGQVALHRPCTWLVTRTDHEATFRTSHTAAGFAYELTRRITVIGAEVISSSHLTNLAATPLVLEWFAHPFWPLTKGSARIALPAGTTLPANPGFTVAPEGTLTFLRPFLTPEDNQFALLTLPPSPSLSLSLDHPMLSRVDFSTSFAPTECPVWANARTVSVEPYLALNLAPGETREWQVRHAFHP
jgi:hypothetical protein